MLLETNLRLILQNNAPLAARLRAISADNIWEIHQSDSGSFTIAKRISDHTARFLHSKIDPGKEAADWVSHQVTPEKHAYIMGMGLGYHIIEFVRKHREIESLHIIEADEGLFRISLEVNDLSEVLSHRGLHLLLGQESDAIAQSLHHQYQFFSYHIYLPVTSLYEEYYNAVIRELNRRLFELRLNQEGNNSPQKNYSFSHGITTLLNEMRS